MMRVWNNSSHHSDNSKRINFEMSVIWRYLILSDRYQGIVLLIYI